MTRRSTTIRAAIAGGAGLATVVGALVGIGPFAAAQGQATAVQSIVPASAAADSNDASSGKGYCQTYKVTAVDDSGSTMNAGSVDVVARPDANSNLDVDFCATMDQGNGAAAAPLNPTNNGPGDFDEASFPIVNGTVTVGVQAVAGNGHATVTATIGSSSKSADLQVLAFPKQGGGTTDTTTQNDVANTLAASPSSLADTPGSSEHFTVTATCVKNPALSDQLPCAADATVGGATISYAITDAQHNVVLQSGHPNGSCGTTSDADGTVDCAITAPTPSASSSGPYTVTFYDHQARCTGNAGTAPQPTCEPTATSTLNSFPAPAANSAQMKVSCGGSSTERTASNQCAEPTSATSETFTATVTKTAAGNGAISDVVVTWSLSCTSSSNSVAGVANTNPNATGTNSGNNGCKSVDADTATYNSGSGTANGTAKLAPTSCVTGSNGTCTTTLTLSKPAPEGLAFDVTGTIKDYTSSTASQESDTASVIFTDKFSAAPTNVAVSAASATPTVGTTDQITATVTNAFGNAAGSGTSVTFTLTGQGTFTDGTVQQTVTTGPDGKARTAIKSSNVGSTTVTAAIDPKQTNCSANGGQCSASTTVVWAGAPSPSPSPTPTPGAATSLPAYRSGSHDYLRNSLNGGSPNSSIAFGNTGDLPLWGDWNGDGTPTVGVFRPSNRTFYLSNDNKTATIVVTIGNAGDLPASGDFNGDGTDSIALFRPSTGTWYITNNDHSVVSSFVYGTKGDRPLVGDWTGQGVSKVGVYRPGTATFYRIGHAGIRFGNVGDRPIVGDWNGDGTTTIGVVRGTTWYCSNNNSSAATSFTYGASGARAFTWSRKASPAAPTSS